MNEEVKARLEAAMPGAEVHIRDFTGGGDHLEANVVWSGFEGLTRLKQHRLVYQALEGLVGGSAPVHALSIKTWSTRPESLDRPADAYGGTP